MPRKWSKEIVVRHILKRHRSGKKLNSGYMQTRCVPLYQAGCLHYGNWQKAIEAAGLKYENIKINKSRWYRPKWNKEKVVVVIRNRYKRSLPLNSNHIQTRLGRLYAAAIKYHGSWPQAVAAAGLDYAKFRKVTMRYWSKKAIVAEILRRSDTKLSIRGGDVANEDPSLYRASIRHFGRRGWTKARMLAGFPPIDPSPLIIWSKETVIQEILQLHENGVPLNTGALGETYGYIRSAGEKHFGSWGKAITAAGLDYLTICKNKPRGWWTKSRLIQAIQNLDKQGLRLSSKSIKESHGDIFGSALSKFGSWSQAVEAAGISYRLHTRVWSTKAWMRRMQEDEYNITLERAQTHAKKRRRIA
ncbi:hypothetical protein IT396_00840 [Candidatus Nomurabacteria bacterium]|nr:hypothetical protein [Candidatus Nomurabacteria bacterium]